MSAEDGPEQLFTDNFSNDSNNSSDQQCFSPKDIFEDVAKEERHGKNKQSKHKTQFIPPVAVPEKIVVCIDSSQDMSLGYTSCETLSNKNTLAQSTVVNEALRVFFITKLAIAKDTKFALASIKPGDVQLLSDFTSDVNHLVKALSEMKGGSHEEAMSEYDVTQLFSAIYPPHHKTRNIPQDFVFRVIFVYNNSYTIPTLNEVDSSYTKLLNSPLCVLDVVYLHEAQSDFNSVVKIYEKLSKIISPRSYILESSRDVKVVFNIFAKLLAHPHQRVSQGLW